MITTVKAAPRKADRPTSKTATIPTKAPTTSAHKQAGARVVTKTVVKRPDVPSGAFLPSVHAALTLASFTVAGGNVGCSLSAGSLRCSIISRVWAPPSKPSTCQSGWGNAIVLTSKGPATFVCGGATSPPAGAKVVADGWDDKLGQYTCQVRTFGVDCFAADGSGLFISRTGYTIY